MRKSLLLSPVPATKNSYGCVACRKRGGPEMKHKRCGKAGMVSHGGGQCPFADRQGKGRTGRVNGLMQPSGCLGGREECAISDRNTPKNWLTKNSLAQLEGWAREGYSDKEIAELLTISPRTLARWRRDHADINKALGLGRHAADAAVEKALFDTAIAGSVTAQVFWLKNRQPERWKDKPELRGEGMTVYIVDDFPPEMGEAANVVPFVEAAGQKDKA